MNTRLQQCLRELSSLDVLDSLSQQTRGTTKPSRCELRFTNEVHAALQHIAATENISVNALVTLLVKWLITAPKPE